MLAALGALAAAAPAGGQTAADPRVIVAVLPPGTTVEGIAAADGISPGMVSAGLGRVPPAQTYLDIGQGNRVNEKLYEDPLPPVAIRDGRVPAGLWEEVTERAAGAPASIVPGLLGSTLAEAGADAHVETVGQGAEPGRRGLGATGLAGLIAVDRSGRVPVRSSVDCGVRGCGAGLSVIRSETGELPSLVEALGERDLLIALTAASPAERLLPAGIAGAGFGGNLTSDSTRTDGLVTATDIAPTVLERLGVDRPAEINGTPIRAEGEPDASAVAELRERLLHRADRDPVVLFPLLAWLAIAALAAILRGARGARVALPLVALAAVWAPLLLLVAAAVDAGELASALLLGLGGSALAAATATLLPGYRGLALACGVTVAAHAVDVIAGSPLTALSVLGPNPSGGVRFFGIGNEHEATLTTLTLIGTGAWLATRRVSPRGTAAWFVAIALAAAVAFAPGRFGADVGAAIVLAAGGGTAAGLALGLPVRRVVAIVVGAAAAGVAALALVDLVLGGAHLSRSVLGASEAGEVTDVLERRLRLMADTFTDPVYPELLVASAVLLVAGLIRRHTVLAWFGGRWAARAGFLGALVGVLVGTVANDSGSTLLVIGTIYLAVCAGFFWGNRGPSADARRTGIALDGRLRYPPRTATRT